MDQNIYIKATDITAMNTEKGIMNLENQPEKAMGDARKDEASEDSASSSSSSSENNGRGNWTSPVDYLLTLIGFTVGLGNIWRFPYLCMRNGGGAFLIPYFLFLVLCGLPLFYLEVSIGQFSSLSALHVWNICPLFKGVGVGMLMVSGLVALYYNTIIAWTLYYLGRSFAGSLPWETCGNEWNTPNCRHRNGWTNNSDYDANNTNGTINNFVNETEMQNGSMKWRTPSEEFWQFEVLDLSPGIHDMGGIRWQLLLCFTAAWIIVFLGLCKGVKSLGRVVYFTATMPYLFLTILLIRGLTLDGSFDGIKYYIVPDFKRLLEFKVWGDACLQIFYTLGPAWGGLITMASYNKFHNNMLRDSIIVCTVCCGTSFFAGFVIFAILGFMAHQVNVPLSEVITSGPGLAFIAYPEALSRLPISPMWAVFFFLMLLTVGLDSQFAVVEVVVSSFIDSFPRRLGKHKMAFTGVVCLIYFLLGLPFVCRGGMYVFQLVDWYCAAFSCMVISLCEVVCVVYIYGVRRFSYDIEVMSGRPLPFIFKILWCAVTPALILVMIVFTSFQMTPPSYGEYEYPAWALGIGWALAMCSVVPIPTVAAWLILRQKGSLLQRLKNVIRPSPTWGPALEKYQREYKFSPVYGAHNGTAPPQQLDPLMLHKLEEKV